MVPTWLVTGASGFLGTNVGVGLGDRIDGVGVVRGHTVTSPFSREVLLDLRDHESIAQCIRDVRPSVILHTAAISGHETCAHDPEQAFAVNVVASGAIAEAATDVGARVIYISTDAVFSGARGNYSEADEPEPFSYYGETKLAGERAVLEAGSRHLVLRTNFFGWSSSGHRSVLEFFVNSLRAGQKVKGYPDFVVTSMYVQSLVQTIWALADAHVLGVVHVASTDAVSKHDFGVTVARVFGLDENLISPEHSDVGSHATSRSRDISLDTSLLASLLGRVPEAQEEGIRRAYLDEPTVGANLRAMEEKQ
jgi:dTDP-4-dehydrorhamnose reductase